MTVGTEVDPDRRIDALRRRLEYLELEIDAYEQAAEEPHRCAEAGAGAGRRRRAPAPSSRSGSPPSRTARRPRDRPPSRPPVVPRVRGTVASMSPELHDDVASLAFLLGTWSGEGTGSYPTIEPFAYRETLRFDHVGEPYLLYVQESWSHEGEPVHFERGFLRPGAGNGDVELVLAHPIGVTEITHGRHDDGDLRLTPAMRRRPDGDGLGRGRARTPLPRRRRHDDLRARHGDRCDPDDAAPRGEPAETRVNRDGRVHPALAGHMRRRSPGRRSARATTTPPRATSCGP